MSLSWLASAGCDSAVEGDVEGVECGFPAVGPAGASAAGGVEAADGQVQHFQRGLVGGEMASGVDGSAESGGEAFDGVGGADDAAGLHVEAEEWAHLGPRVCAEPGGGWGFGFPLGGGLGERVPG